MKKIFYFLTLCLATGSLTSCFDDDSTQGKLVSDITIDDFEKTYSKVAFAGDHLQISPKIDTEYSDMTYAWSVLPENYSHTNDNGAYYYDSYDTISTSRDLDYEVKLKPGTYNVLFQAKAPNGYTVSKSTTLRVTTNLSEGIYVMKETAEGNTELDAYQANGVLAENLLNDLSLGSALSGKPLNLSICYNHWYVNPDDDSETYANMVSIATDKGEFCALRGTDLTKIFDNHSIGYADMASDEHGISLVVSSYSSYFFTNKGCYSIYDRYGKYADYSPSTGNYGVGAPTVESGGSKYCTEGDMMNNYYWGESTSTIYDVDYNGSITVVTDADGAPVDFTGYTCVGCGTSSTMSATLFIFRSKSDNSLSLCQISGGAISSVTPLDASLHISKSDEVKVCMQSATVLYGIDNGTIYAYDWDGQTESAITPQGIGSGETITYVTNMFFNIMFTNGTACDYLVVGTQKGDTYTVYVYNMLGGKPDGEPAMKFSGKGSVKAVKQLNSALDTGNDGFMCPPNYPWCD